MPLLFLTIFNSILGLSVLFPILGPLGRDLGLTELQIGSISTSYALMQLVLSTWWGKKSETAGRKKILLVGVLGFALGFGLFGTVIELGRAGLIDALPLYGLMLASRMIGGAFSSAMLPTAQAYAADLTSRENRTAGMAVIGAAFGLAMIFGPVIGGVTGHFFGLTAPIWLSTIVGLLNGLMVWLRLPEPKRDVHAHHRAPATLRDVATRAWPLLAVAMVSTGALVLMEQTVAFLVEDRLELTHDETPIWMGGALFVYAVVAVAVQGGLVRRVKIAPTTLVTVGMPITIAGLLALMVAPASGAADRMPGFAVIVLGMALQGLGQGLVLPGVTTALSLAVEDTEQGAIAGLNTSAQGIGRLIGPLFGGALYQLQTSAPYAVSAGLLTTVLLFVVASPQMRAIARRGRDEGAADDQEKNVATTQSKAAATTAITGTRPSTDPTR